MRTRGDKTSGVIRPRTLGLGRVSTSPEPLPPPPPPPQPSLAQLMQNKRIRLALLFGALLFVFSFITRKAPEEGSLSNGVPVGDSAASSSLRPNVLEDGDEDGVANQEGEGDDEDGEEERPRSSNGKKSKKASGDDDETEIEEEASEDDEKFDDETVKEGDDESQVVQEESPVQPKRSSSAADSARDKSKTVESYFINFGGRVVEIDREGSYKYVLVRMEDIFGSQALLVRGCPHKEGTHCKHNDAFTRAKAELEMRGFKATVLGGGRITRHPSRHQKGQKAGYISIFGYSKTFGACEECNKLACALIRSAFPDHGVKWANEGYLESDERKVPNDSWSRC